MTQLNFKVSNLFRDKARTLATWQKLFKDDLIRFQGRRRNLFFWHKNNTMTWLGNGGRGEYYRIKLLIQSGQQLSSWNLIFWTKGIEGLTEAAHRCLEQTFASNGFSHNVSSNTGIDHRGCASADHFANIDAKGASFETNCRHFVGGRGAMAEGGIRSCYSSGHLRGGSNTKGQSWAMRKVQFVQGISYKQIKDMSLR